ncbi:MAG TPA: carboxypeptidase-like regulatory domain-containing protein [Candidatus Thermoplasmatota archaeon]|nr:carboxypeptidase-like regulatory domain-containing protein [Candidatus Thermoplasmatota archaeon]
MRGLAALLILLLLAGCSTPSGTPPAATTGRIDGAVLGPLLDPYGNVSVVLADLDWTTTTTPLGGFSFLGVPAGTHDLTVEVADGARDRRSVEVRPGEVTRIILQVQPATHPIPYVSLLQSRGGEDLALPGRDCGGCAWTTTLPQHPDLAVLGASWEGVGLADGRIEVELWDGGTLLAALDVPGDGAAHLVEVAGHDLPGPGGRLSVTVRFSEDFLPQTDLRMASSLELHYPGEASTQAPAAAS